MDWLTSSQAVDLLSLDLGEYGASLTLLSATSKGFVKTRAIRYTGPGLGLAEKVPGGVPIPAVFFQAEATAQLYCDWDRDNFVAVLGSASRRERFTVSGLLFDRNDVGKLHSTMLPPSRRAMDDGRLDAASGQVARTVGRPSKPHAEAVAIVAAELSYLSPLQRTRETFETVILRLGDAYESLGHSRAAEKRTAMDLLRGVRSVWQKGKDLEV